MGYDLHITRAGLWTRSAEYPISRQEWRTAAEAWPGIGIPGGDAPNPSLFQDYVLHGGGEASTWLCWRQGRITLRAYGSDSALIARLAETVGARLVGDDHEVYFPDGTVVDSDANQRSSLLARPLYVNEVAGAWESLLNWEDCVDEGSAALQALRAFRAMAVRDVATSDVPAADVLLYGYGTRMFYGETTFSVRMGRQFAQPDAAGGGVVEVECEVSYRPTPELLELRSFLQWELAEALEARDAWLAGIGERPEWALFDRLIPRDLTLCGNAVYNSRIAAARRSCASEKSA